MNDDVFRDDEGVAISDVDCTPRPRYGESLDAFRHRMAGYAANGLKLAKQLQLKNRKAALRQVTVSDGSIAFVTQCACKWHSLQARDPEVARREYDAHDCDLDNTRDEHVERAMAEVGKTTLARRHAPLSADWAEVTKVILAGEAIGETITSTPAVDEFEARVALLEHK